MCLDLRKKASGFDLEVVSYQPKHVATKLVTKITVYVTRQYNNVNGISAT
jgi:hypothetical protein